MGVDESFPWPEEADALIAGGAPAGIGGTGLWLITSGITFAFFALRSPSPCVSSNTDSNCYLSDQRFAESQFTTFSDGCLGSNNDEGRSEV